MDFNPLHLLYRWANKQLADELAETKRRRNIADREAKRANRDNAAQAAMAEEAEREVSALKGQLRNTVPEGEYSTLQEKLRTLELQLKDAVPRSEFNGLQNKLSLTQAELEGARQRMESTIPLKQYQALQQQSISRIQELEGQLEGMVPRAELEDTQQQLREQKSLATRLQAELFETEKKAIEIGRAYVGLRSRAIQRALRGMYQPIEAEIVAIVAQEPDCIIASAQLIRVGGINVTYAFKENCYAAVSSIRKAKEVVLVGIPLSDDTIKKLRTLYQNGCRITLIGEYNGLEFATTINEGSVSRSLLIYSRVRGRSDGVSEAIAALPDSETGYIRDSILLNPADPNYIQGVVFSLSQKGTLQGSDIYQGATAKAGVYRFLQSHSLL